MPKILCSPASPYSAKVRIAAAYAGIPFEEVQTDSGSQPEALTSINPLGKIPVWIADDGRAMSEVIDEQGRRRAVAPARVARVDDFDRRQDFSDASRNLLGVQPAVDHGRRTAEAEGELEFYRRIDE